MASPRRECVIAIFQRGLDFWLWARRFLHVGVFGSPLGVYDKCLTFERLGAVENREGPE